MMSFLIFDDEFDALAGIEARIKLLYPNSCVDCADTPELALELCSSKKYQIAFIDLINHSGLIGYSVAENIKTISPETKVLLRSNYSTAEIISNILVKNIDGFLPKFISTNDDLISAINDVLNGKKFIEARAINHRSFKTNFHPDMVNPDAFKEKYKLSARQIEILLAIRKADNRKRTAKELNITVDGLADATKILRAKFNAETTHQLNRILDKLFFDEIFKNAN
jgi:DNA-binding NarL/FixJ family response regulator